MDNDSKTLGSKDKSSATWTCNDETVFVRTLKKAKEEGKWGDNNPKEVAWTVCIGALSGSEKTSGGGPKTSTVIRRRWQRVHAPFLTLYARFHVSLQLKQEYELVKNMRDQSGWGWDHTKNAPEVTDVVWDAYIMVRVSYTMQLQLMFSVESIQPVHGKASLQERFPPVQWRRRTCGWHACNRKKFLPGWPTNSCSLNSKCCHISVNLVRTSHWSGTTISVPQKGNDLGGGTGPWCPSGDVYSLTYIYTTN